MWVLPCLAVIGLIEYAGHRWLLHRKTCAFGRDHLQHHKLYTKDFTDVVEVSAWYDRVWMRVLLALTWSSLVMLPIAIWLSAEAAITFVVMATLHGGIWHWVHGQMHRPRNQWILKCGYFRFISRFHAVHHRFPRTNYGFLFAPLFDFLFRTRRSTA